MLAKSAVPFKNETFNARAISYKLLPNFILWKYTMGQFLQKTMKIKEQMLKLSFQKQILKLINLSKVVKSLAHDRLQSKRY